MNNELFDQASVAYERKDYQSALKGYTDCLQNLSAPPAEGEIGLIYHRIGNCLIKLKNPTEAIQAYMQARADEHYDSAGALECNLGMAYASLHDYENAVMHFEAAVKNDSYTSPYKAYMGMGNALLKLGKNAEAGVAFREAALDASNPDPTKALLNLGVCFMALDRPADAIASYDSAFQFDMQPDTRNKLYANLGQAYVACGQMELAVEAFERALADKTYLLSDSASVDYQRAVAAVAQGTQDLTQVLDVADMSGLDVAADGSRITDDTASQDPFYYDEGYGDIENYPGYLDAYEGDDDRFFNATEEELEQWAAGLAKKDRKRRSVGLKILIAVVIILIALLVVGVVLYAEGFGIPSAEAVTEELFADPQAAQDKLFTDSLSASSVEALSNIVVADSSLTIDHVSSSMSSTAVYATATTPTGGEITYHITMVRDLIGWKISNIELFTASQH